MSHALIATVICARKVEPYLIIVSLMYNDISAQMAGLPD